MRKKNLQKQNKKGKKEGKKEEKWKKGEMKTQNGKTFLQKQLLDTFCLYYIDFLFIKFCC